MSAAVARCGYLIRYIICYQISYGIRYSPSAATLTDVYTYRYGGAAGAGEEEEEKEDEEKEKEDEDEDEDEEEEEMQGTGSVPPPTQGGASALGAMGVAEGGPTWGRSEAPPHTGDRPGILSTHVPLLQGGAFSQHMSRSCKVGACKVGPRKTSGKHMDDPKYATQSGGGSRYVGSSGALWLPHTLHHMLPHIIPYTLLT
jgi:hypothetical protein